MKNQAAPKQYVQGYTEFYKLKFKLTPDVLIPRPETELLVDEVLKFVHSSQLVSSSQNRKRTNKLTNNQLTIIDIGTGSGCIAISVAKNAPNTKIFALDISPEALKVAEQNAKLHKVENQILFLESDLLNILRRSSKKSVLADVTVANLPYIPSAKLKFIDPMVKDFEPKIALDGGQDGFELYRKLFTQLSNNSHTGGVTKLQPKVLICEIDEDQGKLALAEARKYFPKAKAEIKKDFYGADRLLRMIFR